MHDIETKFLIPESIPIELTPPPPREEPEDELTEPPDAQKDGSPTPQEGLEGATVPEVGPPTPQEVNHEEAEPIVAPENPPALSHKSSRSSVVSFHEEVKVSAL